VGYLILEGSTRRVLVLVPAYNEERNIRNTISNLLEWMPSEQILVIDDGSSDKTYEIAQQIGIHVLKNRHNMGRNLSVIRGLTWGLKNTYDLFITVDADGQHSPHEIPRIVRHVDEYGIDCIIMSRFLSLRGLLSIPKVDALGVIASSFLVSLSSGIRISDPTTGYIAFSRKAAECLVRYGPALMSLASDNTWAMAQYPLFNNCGLSIRELSTHHILRSSGERKMFSPLKRVLYPVWLFRSFFTIRLALRQVEMGRK
jgi:glycosyltransferase involved in cell wall biosynthesis